MFDDIKREATDKIIKIKLYVSQINNIAPTPPESPGEFYNTLKGLFFVYLYGIFEMVVTKTIRRTIDKLNSSGVNINQCKLDLLPLILSPEFDAIYGVGGTKKWQRRWAVSKKLIDNEPLYINESLFPTDGRNIQKKQLESLYITFGNNNPVFPRPEMQGYLEELVRYRNYIAHGDMLPQEIGRRFTMNDLEIRLSNIDELCTYFIDSFDSYIMQEDYLQAT